MPNLDRTDDAIKAFKAKKALEKKEAEEYYKEFEKEAAKYNLHSTDDDLYLSKRIDNDEEAEEPTNYLVNKDVSSLEAANLIGRYEDVFERATNLTMDRKGYKNFIHYKRAFESLQDKQEKLDLQNTASSEQLEKLDALYDKISYIFDDEELEAKLTKFKDAIPVPAHYDPYTACITIKTKQKPAPTPAPVAAAPVAPAPNASIITYKKKTPEEMTQEELIDEVYTQKQLKDSEWVKVKNLTKQLEEMKKQMEDYNKYKMFFIKNNGIDTVSTQKDYIQNFIYTVYIKTDSVKDRHQPKQILNEYIKYRTQLEPNKSLTTQDIEIRRFCQKLQEIGLERIKSSGVNYFIGLKLKT